jgi:hypothetical protein
VSRNESSINEFVKVNEREDRAVELLGFVVETRDVAAIRAFASVEF